MFIDLHAHTYPASDDSFVGADELIDGAKKTGLDGICLTEHDHFWDPATIQELSRRHNFLVLGGAEINTDEGHVLVFGLHEYRFGMHKAITLRTLIEQHGGAMVAAHPYRRRYPKGRSDDLGAVDRAIGQASQETFFSMCDAIEVLNGRGSPAENSFSNTLCQRLGLEGTGGSDSHRLDQLGKACTRFHRRITCLNDIVREIRAGRLEAA